MLLLSDFLTILLSTCITFYWYMTTYKSSFVYFDLMPIKYMKWKPNFAEECWLKGHGAKCDFSIHPVKQRTHLPSTCTVINTQWQDTTFITSIKAPPYQDKRICHLSKITFSWNKIGHSNSGEHTFARNRFSTSRMNTSILIGVAVWHQNVDSEVLHHPLFVVYLSQGKSTVVYHSTLASWWMKYWARKHQEWIVDAWWSLGEY